MRNALIVLVVVALLLVGMGAVNNGLLFDIDFVAGTWTAVSLFWVAVVIAGVVFVTGVVAAYLAASGAVAARRRLEKELQSTYERLRAAEAKLPKPVPAPVATDVLSADQTAVTGVEPAATATEAPAAVAAPSEAETTVEAAPPEAETAVEAALPEAETVVAAEALPADAEDGADAPPPSAS